MNLIFLHHVGGERTQFTFIYMSSRMFFRWKYVFSKIFLEIILLLTSYEIVVSGLSNKNILDLNLVQVNVNRDYLMKTTLHHIRQFFNYWIKMGEDIYLFTYRIVRRIFTIWAFVWLYFIVYSKVTGKMARNFGLKWTLWTLVNLALFICWNVHFRVPEIVVMNFFI